MQASRQRREPIGPRYGRALCLLAAALLLAACESNVERTSAWLESDPTEDGSSAPTQTARVLSSGDVPAVAYKAAGGPGANGSDGSWELGYQRHELIVAPIGDSLTANRGATDSNGWRWHLDQRARETGYPIRFIGTTASGTFANNRHSGLSACSIACSAAASAKNFAEGGKLHGAEVVMLLIGSKDILDGVEPPVAAAAYKQLVEERIIGALPKLQALVVATIPPLPHNPPEVAAYNAELQRPGGIWDQLEHAHNRLPIVRVDTFADVGGVWNTSRFTGLHPNDTGYALISAGYWRAVGPLFDRLTRVVVAH